MNHTIKAMTDAAALFRKFSEENLERSKRENTGERAADWLEGRSSGFRLAAEHIEGLADLLREDV